MRYKTKDIGEDGIDLDVPLSAKWLLESCPDIDAKLGQHGLRMAARLEPSDKDFLLRGRLHGSLEMTCVRCLEPTNVPLDVPLMVAFVPVAPAEAEGGDTAGACSSAAFL